MRLRLASFISCRRPNVQHEGGSLRASLISVWVLSFNALSATAADSVLQTESRLPGALPSETLECWYWGKAYDAASKTHRQQLLRSNMESLTLRQDGVFETGIEVRAKYAFDAQKRLIRLHGKLYEGIIGHIASDSQGYPTVSFFFAENAEAPEARSRDVPAIDPGDTICVCAAGQP